MPSLKNAQRNESLSPIDALTHDLDPINLRIIYLISQETSLQNVAEKLSLSQGAVSQRLKRIEERFGAQIAERKPLRLLPIGRLLLSFFENITSEHAVLVSNIEKQKSDSESLRIAGESYLLDLDAAPTIATLSKKSTRLSTTQIASTLSATIQLIQTKLADVGITSGKISAGGLVFEKYRNDRCVVICGNEHPLSKRNQLTFDEIAEHPIVAATDYGVIESRINRVQMIKNRLLRSIHRCSDLQAATSLVNQLPNSAAITLESVARKVQSSDKTTIIPILEEWAEVDLFTVTGPIQDRSTHVTEFIRILRRRHK